MRQSRRLAVNGGKKKYWIFDGYNGGSKVGTWSGNRYTLNSSQIKLNTINASTSVAKCYTNSTVSLTGWKKMKIVVTSATGGPIDYRRAGVASTSDTTPSKYATIGQSISTATTYTVDISSQTGNWYVSLWCKPNNQNASETIIKQIWLE